MNGFERRKEQSKRKILDATEILFKKYGIDKVNVNDIARKAGVSKVTIYHLFGNKDKLIYYYIELLNTRFIEHIRELLKTNRPYSEKLEDIFQFSIEMNKSLPGPNDIDVKNDPQLRQLRYSAWEQRIKLFLDFITEGKKQGYLNPDLSDEAIVIYLETLKQGMDTNPELHDKVRYNQKLFRDFLSLVLYGFSKIR